tara:strand:+ start:1061 stop:1342 length:282 start_codon:yes stop_codon:yes gene_type:complete
LKVTWEKEYDIVLLRGDGEEEYLLGRGSLEEGNKILGKLEAQFLAWLSNDETYFDLPKPYNKVPISIYTGSDILAHAHDEEYIYVPHKGWTSK